VSGEVCKKSHAQPRFSVLKTTGLRFPALVCQKELVSAQPGFDYNEVLAAQSTFQPPHRPFGAENKFSEQPTWMDVPNNRELPLAKFLARR